MCNPATFFLITVCRRSGFRYRADAIRQIFIFPIPCSTTIRRRDNARFARFCSTVNTPFRGFFCGTGNRVPTYPVSPTPDPPFGRTVRERSYSLLSCVFPVAPFDTAAIRTRRFSRGSDSSACRFRPTTTWCFTVCLFFTRVTPPLPPLRPRDGLLGRVPERLAALVLADLHPPFGDAEDARQQQGDLVDAPAGGRLVDAEQEAEELLGDVGAVIDQEQGQPPAQVEGVVATAARFPLPTGAGRAPLPRCRRRDLQLTEEPVELCHRDAGQTAEGGGFRAESVDGSHTLRIPTDALFRNESTEERSADLAVAWLRPLGVLDDLLTPACELILATNHRTEPQTPDARVLVDADLAILGAAEVRYQRYAADIRKEYAWVPDADYRAGRITVLRHFLARPFIFSTDTLRAEGEESARRNLAAEIVSLSN